MTGQDAQLGRFVNIPAFGDQQMPTWKNFSPRTSFVYDLFGNGKTAVRFGFNRFGVAATTTLASLYDPANGTIISATAPWTDKNGDNIAQGGFRCNFATDPNCEINFASVPANFGVISLAQPDRKSDAPVRRRVQRRRHARAAARRVGVRGMVPQRSEKLVGAQQHPASGHATPTAP